MESCIHRQGYEDANKMICLFQQLGYHECFARCKQIDRCIFLNLLNHDDHIGANIQRLAIGKIASV